MLVRVSLDDAHVVVAVPGEGTVDELELEIARSRTHGVDGGAIPNQDGLLDQVRAADSHGYPGCVVDRDLFPHEVAIDPEIQDDPGVEHSVVAPLT